MDQEKRKSRILELKEIRNSGLTRERSIRALAKFPDSFDDGSKQEVSDQGYEGGSRKDPP